jgi:hypothetical protein
MYIRRVKSGTSAQVSRRATRLLTSAAKADTSEVGASGTRRRNDSPPGGATVTVYLSMSTPWWNACNDSIVCEKSRQSRELTGKVLLRKKSRKIRTIADLKNKGVLTFQSVSGHPQSFLSIHPERVRYLSLQLQGAGELRNGRCTAR